MGIPGFILALEQVRECRGCRVARKCHTHVSLAWTFIGWMSEHPEHFLCSTLSSNSRSTDQEGRNLLIL